MGKIKRRVLPWVVVALIATVFCACIVPKQADAAAGINSQINFQGKLVLNNIQTGTNVGDGAYNMRFKLYQDGTGCLPGSGNTTVPCGGTLLWTETRLISASQGVNIANGIFQVNLGSVNNTLSGINWNQDTVWLSMEVGGASSGTVTWDGEMTPFIRMTSVPYALNAGKVGGLSASQLVQLTPGAQQTGSINVSGNIMTGGTLQAATLDQAASGVLTVGGSNTTGVTLGKNTTITSGQTLTVGGQTVFSGTGILQAAALSSSVAYTNLTQVGTITAGTWNATTIAPGYGGTGITSYTVGDLLYASGTTTLAKLAAVATGSCLTSAGTGTAPAWGSCGANAALSNLSGVAINTSLLPGANNAIDVGSSSLAFRSGFYGTSVTTPVLQSAAGAGLTITGNANSTIGTTSGNLTISAAGTGSLGLDTGGAGTVGLGDTNAATINIGRIGSTSGTGSINMGTTTGAAQNIDIGGNGTSTGSNAGTTVAIQGGSTSFTVAAGGANLQTFTNSTNALQVQNASGAAVLTVDTTNTTNLLTNPGFETGVTGWSFSGTGTNCSQTTAGANAYLGNAGYACNLASSGTSTFTVGSTGLVGGTIAAGSYTFSFYARSSVAVTLGTTVTFSGGGTCTLNTTAVVGNFQRFQCSVTTTAATTSISFNTATTGTGNFIYIDSAQLQTGTAATPYSIGGIQLRGIITDPVAIQPGSDSSTAFQVATTAGLRIFTVDTEAAGDPLEVQIGSSTTPDNVQVLFGLDSYTAFADGSTCGTTTNQGTMYYNTVSASMRACVNGSWEDLVSTGGLALLSFGIIPDSGVAAFQGDIAGKGSTSAGVGPCKVAWASTTSVTVTACSAYSGARKVTYAGGTFTGLTVTSGVWTHLCFNSSGTLVASATGTETANLPTWSASAPLLCIADIRGTGSAIQIYETRVFVNSLKSFAYTAVAAGHGWLMKDNAGTITSTGTTAAQGFIVGSVAATNGAAWAAGSGPNAIIVTGGPAYVKAIAGTLSATATVQNSATASYATASTTVPTIVYSNVGTLQTAFNNTCNTAVNCTLSVLVNINIK